MDALEMLRAAVEVPRINVPATDLNGGRNLTELRRYMRRLPAMPLRDLKLLRARIHYMADDEWHDLSAGEKSGVYMLTRILRDEEARRDGVNV